MFFQILLKGSSFNTKGEWGRGCGKRECGDVGLRCSIINLKNSRPLYAATKLLTHSQKKAFLKVHWEPCFPQQDTQSPSLQLKTLPNKLLFAIIIRWPLISFRNSLTYHFGERGWHVIFRGKYIFYVKKDLSYQKLWNSFCFITGIKGG